MRHSTQKGDIMRTKRACYKYMERVDSMQMTHCHNAGIQATDMELDQLRHFVKVADCGSFTRAAEDVGLSQPALSRSIARLETELGQPLFDRQTRRISLTDAGGIVLDRARSVLAMVEDLKTQIRDDGQSGRIRLGAIPTIAPYFLPKLLKTFGNEFPHSQVVVQEDTTAVLLTKLSEGEIDLAVLARPLETKYVEVEDLFAEELYVVLSAENPLARKKQLSLVDLESEPFVLLAEAHCLTDNILNLCRQKSLHPVSIERTSQLMSIQELVSLNHGVSLIPAMAKAVDSSDRRIYRSLTDPKPTRQIVMAWNPFRFQSRLLEAFKTNLRVVAAACAKPRKKS
jgi:LysR family hydrogen peroxide-inducible transcriptional activator